MQKNIRGFFLGRLQKPPELFSGRPLKAKVLPQSAAVGGRTALRLDF